MSLEELAGVVRSYTIPKLTGDWEVSASSEDPSDSEAEDFSSHLSCSEGKSSEDSKLTARSSEVERHCRALFGRKYIQPKSFIGNEDPFKFESFRKFVRSEAVIGPRSEYVVLLASDGHAFVIKRKYAFASKVLHMYFNRTYPSRLNIWNLHNRVPSLVLIWVCYYLAYKSYHTKHLGVLPVPDFPIPYKLAYDLLMAAYMLKC